MNATPKAVDSNARRTIKDLRALVAFHRGTLDEFAGGFNMEMRRIERLRAHGWVTGDSRHTLTADGLRLAKTAGTLADRDELELAVGIMQMGPFIETALAAPPERTLAFIGEVFTMVNMVDEAAHEAGTLDLHDVNGPMFKDYDVRRGTIEVAFKDKRTADVFRLSWVRDRWTADKKTDFRFSDDMNPRRFIVDVLGGA